MRIASRLLLLFIVIAIVFGAFFYLFYHIKHEEMRLYREADLDQRRQTIDAVLKIKSEAQMQQTLDYAISDETVNYIHSRDPEWARENLRTINSNLNYSLVQIYDTSGRILYSNAKDDIPGLNSFRLEPTVLDSLGAPKGISFFARYYQHILSCTVSSIHPTMDLGMESPVAAYLLFAQTWNYAYISELSKILNYDIRMNYEEPGPREDTMRYNTRILKPLHDHERQSVAWLEFYSSNPFLSQLRNMGNLILFGTMGFIFIFLLMQFFLIQQWINTPLTMISKSMMDADPSQIQKLKKANNEFADIAELIDRFFEQKANLLIEIDERIKSEAKVREMEEQTRKILQTSPEAIVVTDLKGKIIDVNNEALKMFNHKDQSTLISTEPQIEQMVQKKDRRQFQEILQSLGKGSYIKSREISIQNNDGKSFPVLLSASVILDDQGIAGRFIFVARDISDIRTLEQQLRQSQKMESIGTLAGGIAHDFNNIITIIAGYIALASGKIDDPKEAESDMEAALKACLRAKSLIGKILTFSRQSEPDMEDLIPAQVIEESLPMIRALLPTKIKINTKIQSHSYTTADHTELQQVLINLSTNAYHAMRPDGGDIFIELSEINGTELVGIDPNLNPKQRYLHLSVSDTGCGIAPDILSRIFDPYFSTKSSGEGTGLGLSIVHGIVSGYKGFISVRSVLSEGTSINIYLPINENPKVKPKQEVQEDAPFIPAHLMVVDDEKALTEIFSEALCEAGYTVETFTDSQKAYAAFAKQPKLFDLIIADINMPQMDGIKLAEKVREIRHIPVVLYTGFLDLNLQNRVENAGIHNVLSKPILPDAMTLEVKRIIFKESGISILD